MFYGISIGVPPLRLRWSRAGHVHEPDGGQQATSHCGRRGRCARIRALWDAGRRALVAAGDNPAAAQCPGRQPGLSLQDCGPLPGRRHCSHAHHDVRILGPHMCLLSRHTCHPDAVSLFKNQCGMMWRCNCCGTRYRLRDTAPDFADATCLAIACPACMTVELARSCSDYVTTIINSTDIVPTISRGTPCLALFSTRMFLLPS